MFCINVNENEMKEKKIIFGFCLDFASILKKSKNNNNLSKKQQKKNLESQIGLKQIFDEVIRCVLFPKKVQKKRTSLLQRFLPFVSNSSTIRHVSTKTTSVSERFRLKNALSKNYQFSWVKINTDKIIGSAIRYGHTSASTNDKIIILGGVDDKGLICKSILEFDIENECWKHIENETEESSNGALQFAASATLESKIYIFGGRSKYYNQDLFEFDSFDQKMEENNKQKQRKSKCKIWINSLRY